MSTVKVLLCLLLIAVSPSLEAQSTRARRATTAPTVSQGTIQAEFDVNSQGAATYDIEIKVPPGTNGMEPILNLTYSSSTRNGLAGMGWTLNGLYTISRTGANIAQDGFKGGINYDDKDRFEWNGQRLLELTDVQVTDGFELAAEVEEWNRIVAYNKDDQGNTCGSGPCWFEVTTKQGMVQEYGRTTDSRIPALGGDGSIRVWAMNKQIDLNGNYMEIEYTNTPYTNASDQGQYYPKTINYSANDAEQQTHQRQVSFTYQQRSDIIAGFVGGYPVNTNARLTRITTSVLQNEALRFDLDYEYGAATGRSRMTSITMCGNQGNDCLRPTQFIWQELDPTFDAAQTWLSNDFVLGWKNSDPRFIADVNGDGLQDIVGFRTSTQVGLSTGRNSFAAAAEWNADFGLGWTDQTPRELGDVNGDGLADVVGFDFRGLKVAPSNGSKFDENLWSPTAYPYYGFDPSAGGWTRERNPRMLADVNGDGLSDIVGFNGETYVALSTGSSFPTPVSWNKSDFTGSSWYLLPNRLRFLGDVNGDGRADVVGFEDDKIIVGIATGGAQSGSFDLSLWPQNQTGYKHFTFAQGYTTERHPRMIADVNGDGMMDIVGFRNGVQVGLSNGKGFEDPTIWIDDFSIENGWAADWPRFTADINGDGLADVIGADLSGTKAALSNGVNAFSKSPWNQDSLPGFRGGNPQYLLTLGEFNGDGITDMIAFGADRSHPSAVRVGLAAGPYPDLMTRLTNGLGGRYTVDYASLTDPEVYDKNQISIPIETRAAVSLAAVGDEAANSLGFFNTPVSFTFNSQSSNFSIKNIIGGHVYLVAKTTEDVDPAINPATYTYVNTYFYHNARMENISQRWLGMAARVQTDHDLGRKTTEYYNQVFPLTYRTALTETACADNASDPNCSDGAVMERAYQHWKGRISARGNNVYDVLMEREQTDYLTYDTYNFSIGTNFEYNIYNDPDEIVYLGYVNRLGQDQGGEDNVYTFNEYFSDDQNGAWNLGFLIRSLQTRAPKPESTFTDGVDLTLRAFAYEPGTFNLLKEKQWDDQANVFLAYENTYDGFGNKITTEDPQGYTYTTQYDTTFNTFPAIEATPALASNGNQPLITESTYDPVFDEEVASKDPNGNLTLSCLDPFGRLAHVQVTPPSGVTQTTTACAKKGLAQGQQVVQISNITWASDDHGIYKQEDALQDWPGLAGDSFLYQKQYLDGRERTWRTQTQDDPDDGDVVTCTSYNTSDSPLAEAIPFFGKNLDCGVPGVLYETHTYDVIDRELESTMPNGPEGLETIVTTFQYPQADVTIKIEASGTPDAFTTQIVSRFYNSEPKEYNLILPDQGQATSTFEYDPLGRLIKTTGPATKDNPDGVVDRYTIDSMDRLVKAQTADMGTLTYDYKGTEWLKTLTDAYGAQQYTYDAIGRLTNRKLGNQTTDLGFSYDATDVPNGLGQLTGARVLQNDVVTYDWIFGYDTRENKSLRALTYQDQTWTVTRNFDPQKRMRTLIWPDNSTQERLYQYANLITIKVDGTTLIELSHYNPQGDPGSYTYPKSGISETITYYPTGYRYTQEVAVANNNLLSTQLDWNDLLLVDSFDDLLDANQSQDYSYTERRLTRVSGGVNQSFDYDASGNLTGMDGVVFSYNAHQMTQGTLNGRTVFSAGYDGLGSMISRTNPEGSLDFTYDPLAQLAEVKRDDQVVNSFDYDPFQDRVGKTDQNGGKVLYMDPTYQITLDATGQTTQTSRYLMDEDGRAAVLDTDSSGATENRYLHRNWLLSTVLVTDDQGTVLAAYRYAPYGDLLDKTQLGLVRPKFTSKELDEEAQLYYFESRYYDPLSTRMTTADNQWAADLTVQDALNRYAYALNQPTTLNDPDGHAPPLIAALAAGLAKAGAAIGKAVLTTGARTLITTGARTLVTSTVRSLAPTGMRATLHGGSRAVLSTGARTALNTGSRSLSTFNRGGSFGRLRLFEQQRRFYSTGGKKPFRFDPKLIEPKHAQKIEQIAKAERKFLIGENQRLVVSVARDLKMKQALHFWPKQLYFKPFIPKFHMNASIRYNQYLIQQLQKAGFRFYDLGPTGKVPKSHWYRAEKAVLKRSNTPVTKVKKPN